MYQTPSRIQDVHTYATFPPMDSINQSTVASSGWFIGMILALLFLLAVCVTVCLIKRNRSVSARQSLQKSAMCDWVSGHSLQCLQTADCVGIHYARLSADLDTESYLHAADLFSYELN